MKIQSGQKILLNTGKTATIIQQNGNEPDFFVWYQIDNATGFFSKKNTTEPCLNWNSQKNMWIQQPEEY